MEVNINRIIERINEIYSVGKQNDGTHTRMAYSSEELEARKIFSGYFDELDVKTNNDKAGNLIARIEGTDSKLPSIVICSHLDTVPDGGKYDGLLGCVAGLEIANVLKESNIRLRHPLEIISFCDEEGFRFGSGMTGSLAFSGLDPEVNKDDLDKSGKRRYEIFKDFGIEFDEISEAKREKDSILATLELHIEQGASLDMSKIPIGIVTTIAGVRRYEINVFGESNHSGSTMMSLRNDALVKASKFISELPDLVKNFGNKFSVGTVGTIKVSPNSVNVIPGKCTFNLEIRDKDEHVMDTLENESVKLLEKHCGKKDKDFNISLISRHKPADMNKELMNIIEDAAKKLNYNYEFTPSGAFHDSLILTEVFKSAMIFVPSVRGLSHCREEFTEPDDIRKGCNVLLETVLQLDKMYDQR